MSTALLVPNGLVAPTITYFDDAGEVTVTLTFPQDMNQTILPGVGSIVLKTLDGSPEVFANFVWRSATEFECSKEDMYNPSNPLLLDWSGVGGKFTTLLGEEYSTFSDLVCVPV